ncbi:MAG: serine hydrolase [Planctomycetota bacterium]
MREQKFLVVVLLLLVCSSRPAHAQIENQLNEKIGNAVQDFMRQNGVPGMSVAVGGRGEMLFSNGFGLADVENQVPATAITRYRTGSIAKPMTAALILSLADDKKLDLNADIRTYVPGFPKKRWAITSRQLLGHLGGIRHYKSAAEATSTRHFFTRKSALQTFANDPLIHPPGTKYRYSSFGYNLLGSVAEGASGDEFMSLLRDRVFDKAGMQHTVVDDSFAVISNRARGYVRASPEMLNQLPADSGLVEGELYNSTLHDTSMKVPSGGLLSTAPDLVRFAQAMHRGTLLEDSTRRQMWTRQKTTSGEETRYGLGWNVGRSAVHPIVSHGGSQSGTSTYLLLNSQSGTCVAIMSNLQRLSLRSLAVSIAELVEPPSYDYGPAIEKLRAAVRYEVAQKDLPAFSISMVDRNQTVWAEGFGFQDPERSVPATAETVYRVGSVSKLFTDIAIMQLAEDGQVDLDTPVRNYLPDFQPEIGDHPGLTLRQMMSHRSGLVRESPVGNYFDPSEPSLAKTVASLNQTGLVYEPETKTKYSNAAVAVVGAVLESQLDVSHPQRVRETILQPLGMNDSRFVVPAEGEPKLATGWMRTYDDRRFEAPGFLLGTGPAGNMYSNVLDLAKFVSCLFNEGKLDDGEILSVDSLNEMLTPVVDSDGKPQGFGLGFHLQKLDGYSKVGHGGAVYGFSTQLEALPERELGVVAASSLDGSNGVARRLSDYALRLMIATQDGSSLPEYRTTVSVPTERARRLEGVYREVDGERFAKLWSFEGDLFMQRGSFRHKLGIDDAGKIITDDEIGFGTEVKLLEDGRVSIGDVPYQALPAQTPEEIPERWRGLIGEYGWDHNTLYILEEDGKLFALIEWFYYYPLTEVSDDKFEFPDYGLYHGEGLTFTRDAVGRATEVTAAEVRFLRREIGTKDGETFRIKPVKPIDELRDVALAASPPKESGNFLESDLVELVRLDPTIQLDIRYASTNNFTGAVFYQQPKAYMQRPAAEAVARVNARLKAQGLGLLVHDAYRPWHVTKMFWDATPGELKDFVANPANGSRHNRGCAVDLTLYDLASGKPIQLVAGYDEFSPRSFPKYPGGTSRQRWYRDLLRKAMESEGFSVYEYEWWHFDFKDWKRYRIGNATFEELADPTAR